MTIKASDLPDDVRYEVLRRVREKFGDYGYDRLVGYDKEDSVLLDFYVWDVLREMIPERPPEERINVWAQGLKFPLFPLVALVVFFLTAAGLDPYPWLFSEKWGCGLTLLAILIWLIVALLGGLIAQSSQLLFWLLVTSSYPLGVGFYTLRTSIRNRRKKMAWSKLRRALSLIASKLSKSSPRNDL